MILWSALNNIGTSGLLRSSWAWLVFVPLAARILRPFPDEVQLKFWGGHYSIALALPFSWKLFFFAALSIGVGSFLYAVFCPDLVRSYQSVREFEEKGKGLRDLAAIFADMHLSSGSEELKANDLQKTDIQTFFTLADELPLFWELDLKGVLLHETRTALYELRSNEQPIGDLFWFVRGREDQTYPFIRGVCLLVYLAGAIMLLIVLMQNILFVLGE